jgi:hypothetical protein
MNGQTPMKRLNPTSVLMGCGLFLGLLTLAALAWVRICHPVVSGQPGPADQTRAVVVWLSASASYYVVVPAALALWRRDFVGVAWPAHEISCLVAIVLSILLSFLQEESWFGQYGFLRLFPSDVALTCLCYVLATVGYVVAVATTSSTRRARSWPRFTAACVMMATFGASIFGFIWAIPFFRVRATALDAWPNCLNCRCTRTRHIARSGLTSFPQGASMRPRPSRLAPERGFEADGDSGIGPDRQTLNLKCITSPSRTT